MSGQRVQVELPGFKGQAGLVVDADGARLAYRTERGAGAVPVGHEFEAAGRRWRVREAYSSQFVKKMTVLTLEGL